MSENTESQRERFDRDAIDYGSHHGDPFSQKYRNMFMRDKIFNFDLKDQRVLDAMSGPGVETEYLIEKKANIRAIDISPENARIYEEKWGLPCAVGSIDCTGFENESFDVVYICGGLHHVVPLLGGTMKEIHRILKPGGYFCFVEPNADDLTNFFRRIWYRFDNRFGDSEEAISYKKTLKPKYLPLGFVENYYECGGNVAYLLIAQSMITRMPSWMKSILYRPLFLMEKLLNKIPFFFKLYMTARWQKI